MRLSGKNIQPSYQHCDCPNKALLPLFLLEDCHSQTEAELEFDDIEAFSVLFEGDWIAVVCASKAVAFAATMKQRAARMSYPLCMYVYLSNEVYMSIGNSRKCFRTPLTFYGSCLYYKKLRSQRNSSNELYTKVYSHLVTYHQQCWDKTRGNLSCTFLM